MEINFGGIINFHVDDFLADLPKSYVLVLSHYSNQKLILQNLTSAKINLLEDCL